VWALPVLGLTLLMVVFLLVVASRLTRLSDE
jgi:hypothetical protein